MSSPGIFLIQPNGELVEMNEQAYNSEDLLQTLLAKYPSLLAGNQIDPKAPWRWLFIEREAGVPSMDGGSGRWSADHLFLDHDAIPTIVEVKRSSDTRIRREVVGQMLDYAANAVVYWPAERLRERFMKTHGESADERLTEFLDDQMEPEEFWQLANKNLQDRNIRLLFVADEIPTELQRIVEFLNEQMDRTEVLAIEIKQFVGANQTGLVPRVIGQTAEAKTIKTLSGSSGKIDETRFFEALAEHCSAEEIETARRILNWSKEKSSYVKWRNKSFAPYFETDSHYSHIPTGVAIDGTVGINFKRMKHSGLSDENLFQVLNRLNEIGIELKTTEGKPNFPLSTLTDSNALETFLEIIAWTVEQVRIAQPRRDTSKAAIS